MNTIFIGIAGGTGSGKTTLTEHLVSRFGDDIAVVHHDNYYKRQDCSFEERCKQNYNHPDAFDTDLMIQDLKKLKAGQTIYCASPGSASPARASTPRPSTGPPLWRWSPTFPACPARETPP